MSTIQKHLIFDIFSFQHYKEIRYVQVDTNLKVLISSPIHPYKVKLFQGNNSCRDFPVGIISCHDYPSLAYILDLGHQVPQQTWTLLLDRFKPIPIKTLYILLNEDYISRSIVIPMAWCKRLWSLQSSAYMIAVTSVYYSVLGGALCSLGKNNTKYAYKAAALAIQQIELAKRLKDRVLECRCWLYYAEDLIQLGEFDTAHKIITQQIEFIKQSNDPTLMDKVLALSSYTSKVVQWGSEKKKVY